jgi:peptide-methionine (S)-S-oxide reductase
MFFFKKKSEMVSSADALPGRTDEMIVPRAHHVSGNPLEGPFPADVELAQFAMGCFWGAERIFWQRDGVFTTAVGYAGGYTPNPHYEEVCSGQTGHTEIVLVGFRAAEVSYETLLKIFWESHDPTQGMGQGNDRGTQYRSAIYCSGASQLKAAKTSRRAFQKQLKASGYGAITTEIEPAPAFFYAEDYHQQYLAKNPGGYCGMGGTGVTCSISTGISYSEEE